MTPAAQLARYTAVAWTPEDLIELRALPADRDSGARPASLWLPASDIAGKAELLESMNRLQGLNIYAGILPRKAEGGKTDADALPGRVAWADFDGIDAREAWRTATAAGLPRPSMAVASGHGAHLYWRLIEPATPEDLSGLVGDLAALVGSDRTVKNPSRILRLPGLMNHKAPPAPCVLLHADPETRYAFGDLRGRVPVHTPDAPCAVEGTGRAVAAPDVLERARAYLETIPGKAEGQRNATAYRVAAVLARDFGLNGDAFGLLADWNRRNTPPLTERELQAVLRSAERNAKHIPGHLRDAPAPRRLDVAASVCVTIAPPSGDALAEMLAAVAEQRRRRDVRLPWTRLAEDAKPLRQGTVAVLAGPPGAGKSYFALSIALAVHGAGETWAFLPLEDARSDALLRALAILERDYRLADGDPGLADWREASIYRHAATLASIGECVSENPRNATAGEVPALPPDAVLDWTRDRIADGARLIVIDPLAQIDLDATRDPWKAEAAFIRACLALARGTDSTILLVLHTRKGAGKDDPLDRLQGAAAFSRLAHCVLVLEGHEAKTSPVFRSGGVVESVEHNRTLHIAKARHGNGTGRRLAFSQDPAAPVFCEHGGIAPKTPKPAPLADEHWANA